MNDLLTWIQSHPSIAILILIVSTVFTTSMWCIYRDKKEVLIPDEEGTFLGLGQIIIDNLLIVYKSYRYSDNEVAISIQKIYYQTTDEVLNEKLISENIYWYLNEYMIEYLQEKIYKIITPSKMYVAD